MSPAAWIPIEYRDFYDVPRMFVIEFEGSVLLFDSEFDSKSEEYSSKYSVYALGSATLAELRNLVDWRKLADKGRLLGTLDIKDVKFDTTSRRFINGEVLNALAV